MTLQVEQTSGALVATAVVTNVGRHSITYFSGCGLHLGLAVLDSQGNRLHLSCGPEPLCPDGAARLSPGETRTGGLRFEGVICQGGDPGTMQPVAPGQYRVIAFFHYLTGNEQRGLEEIREFTWGE